MVLCVPIRNIDNSKLYIFFILTLSLPTLQQRRLVADLTFLHHLTSGKITASLSPHLEYIPPSITRGHHLQFKKTITQILKI